ncbi:glycosyltransferase family 4 protein [Nanoarchaeota archaeon]
MKNQNSLENLVIVVRADPIICGHSTEARNLAEAALAQGVNKVDIVTYPLDLLKESGLPLKPEDSILPYSEGITVHRPEEIGDYKVLDGRTLHGMSGKVIDILEESEGTTAIMDLYLVPHAKVVNDAASTFRLSHPGADILTIAEAVGSDVTNVVENAVQEGNLGAAELVLASYLKHDVLLAVSEYTKEVIVEAAKEFDKERGTSFAPQLEERIQISYPAVDSSAYLDIENRPDEVRQALTGRELEKDRYVLFLSRVTDAKGVDDLIDGYQMSGLAGKLPLVIAGSGPAQPDMVARAAGDPNVIFFTDIPDNEKGILMHGSGSYVFPTRPRPEFVETFGIALAEKMLAGGSGPVITTRTGGVPEAVGDNCLYVETDNPDNVAQVLNQAHSMPIEHRLSLASAAREYALQFDRANVFGNILNIAGYPQAHER